MDSNEMELQEWQERETTRMVDAAIDLQTKRTSTIGSVNSNDFDDIPGSLQRDRSLFVCGTSKVDTINLKHNYITICWWLTTKQNIKYKNKQIYLKNMNL